MDGSSSRELPPLIGVQDAASALIAAGHRRFALVTAISGDPEGAFRQLCGFLADQRLQPARLIETEGSDDKLDRLFFTVFRGTRYPTAVLCADSGSAAAARESLRVLGFADIVVLQAATHQVAAPVQLAGFA